MRESKLANIVVVNDLGVQQSRTSDFLVRTSVPAECPIVWANSVDRLVQIGTAGTSWYESGTE